MNLGERIACWLEQRSTVVLAAVAGFGLALTLAAVEGLLAVMLAHPERLPAGFLLSRAHTCWPLSKTIRHSPGASEIERALAEAGLI